MNLDISIETAGCADGTYRVRAKGCIAAALYWANDRGQLPDWTSFACIPIAPNGEGLFRAIGHRAIPDEATHVLARAVRQGLTEWEEVLQPLPLRYIQSRPRRPVRFGVITDLHLSGKPGRVRRALGLAAESGAVLCTGDMVNDGLPEQYALLRETVEDVLPEDTPMLAVSGNHDWPPLPIPQETAGVCDWPTAQSWLLERAEKAGLAYRLDESGAYAVGLGGIDIVGLNVASHWRKMGFQTMGQLSWLDRHLETTPAPWHIVLCHAPLLAHNPQRREGDAAYFSRDGQLQRILERHRNVIMLSGHTHISFNCLRGCVDMDRVREELYVNCGSIRTTTLKQDEPLQPKEWTDGNIVRLEVADEQVEITAVSMHSGQRIARGYYRFTR